ncbi:MAG: DUF374 domain-containing protein [Elusimicrobia bacterium]|nr:DUF374 domain-containing protein [Candidatus Obscuribacterium magneticum]
MTDAIPRITWLHCLVSYVGAGYLHLVGRTSFVQKWDDPEFLSYRRKRRPLIYALWHNAQVFLAYAHRGEQASIMVSLSKDGEYIAQIMKRMGLKAVRGSSSRGGDQAMREMLLNLEKGGQAGFTPDGPRGPVFVVQGGVITAAQMSGAPIVPTAVTYRRQLVFRTWDKYRVPLPFDHIVVAHGKPFKIGKDMSVEEAKGKIKEAIGGVWDGSDEADRAAPSWFSSLSGLLLFYLYNVSAVLLLPFWMPFLFIKYGVKRSLLDLSERLGRSSPPRCEKPLLWLHSASLGEWQAAEPLYKDLSKDDKYAFFVTVTSPEAKQTIRKSHPNLTVQLLPVDLPWIVTRWLKTFDPHALLIVETELWANLLHAVHRKNVPAFIVNGRISKRSALFWSVVRPLAWRIMSRICGFYMRTEADAERFCRLGASPRLTEITGNLKTDNVKVLTHEDKKAMRLKLFGFQDGVILVGGSTWPGEEKDLLKIFGILGPKSVWLVLAPRRKERIPEVARLLAQSALPWSTWSQVKEKRIWDTKVLLVDTFGDLKDLYGAADMAFIGGSLFPKGGQNPIEPASARLALIMGPHMDNFLEEARELKKVGAARQVNDGPELLNCASEMLAHGEMRQARGDAAARWVINKQGGVHKTLEGLKRQLGP